VFSRILAGVLFFGVSASLLAGQPVSGGAGSKVIPVESPKSIATIEQLAADNDGAAKSAAAPVAGASPLADSALSGARAQCARPRVWIQGDALYWWVKDGPLGAPLVTRGNPADGPLAGALGQPGTSVLYGGRDVDFGATTGFRLTAGGWLDDAPFGGEVSVFWLNAQTESFRIGSNGSGNPPIYIPVFNALTNAQGRVVVSDPVLGFAGNVAVASRSRLLGTEANALFAVTQGECANITLLAGLRFMELNESLDMQSTRTDIILGTRTTFGDAFDTRNRFYGAQIGARAEGWHGSWFAGLTAKFAVGYTHELIDTTGTAVQTATAALPAGTFPGGLFTQPTNLGQRTANDFSVVPELNLRLGCQVTSCLRAYVGLDYLYWCQVARPGDQLDRAVNPSQSPVLGAGSLIGAARPAPQRTNTGYSAQGVTAGLEFRY
jgi:Putative beta barrel porin-7 (BBP7)